MVASARRTTGPDGLACDVRRRLIQRPGSSATTELQVGEEALRHVDVFDNAGLSANPELVLLQKITKAQSVDKVHDRSREPSEEKHRCSSVASRTRFAVRLAA